MSWTSKFEKDSEKIPDWLKWDFKKDEDKISSDVNLEKILKEFSDSLDETFAEYQKQQMKIFLEYRQELYEKYKAKK